MSESTAQSVLRTEDGLDLPVRWWYAETPRATVVLVHGFTASKDHPDVVAVAEHLRATGFDVVSYDARGHGASAGESTLGDLERHDVAAAQLADADRVRPERLLDPVLRGQRPEQVDGSRHDLDRHQPVGPEQPSGHVRARPQQPADQRPVPQLGHDHGDRHRQDGGQHDLRRHGHRPPVEDRQRRPDVDADER